MTTISAVKVFTRSFILQNFSYTLGTPTYFQKHLTVLFFFFFFFFLTAMYQEFTRDVLYFFSTNSLLLTVIDKFTDRNRCTNCFNIFRKISTGASGLQFSLKLLSANIRFVNYSRLKFSQIFRT